MSRSKADCDPYRARPSLAPPADIRFVFPHCYAMLLFASHRSTCRDALSFNSRPYQSVPPGLETHVTPTITGGTERSSLIRSICGRWMLPQFASHSRLRIPRPRHPPFTVEIQGRIMGIIGVLVVSATNGSISGVKAKLHPYRQNRRSRRFGQSGTSSTCLYWPSAGGSHRSLLSTPSFPPALWLRHRKRVLQPQMWVCRHILPDFSPSSARAYVQYQIHLLQRTVATTFAIL